MFTNKNLWEKNFAIFLLFNSLLFIESLISPLYLISFSLVYDLMYFWQTNNVVKIYFFVFNCTYSVDIGTYVEICQKKPGVIWQFKYSNFFWQGGYSVFFDTLRPIKTPTHFFRSTPKSLVKCKLGNRNFVYGAKMLSSSLIISITHNLRCLCLILPIRIDFFWQYEN